MVIKVLGSGCDNCKKVKALAAEVIEELDVDGSVQEVTDLQEIMSYGVEYTHILTGSQKRGKILRSRRH